MKNGDLSIAFSVQRTGGSPTGPDPENRVGDQDSGITGRTFLLGCNCPVNRDIFVHEQDPLGHIPAASFLQNVLHLHQQRWVILRVDILALLKLISVEDTVLIPKNPGENFSSVRASVYMLFPSSVFITFSYAVFFGTTFVFLYTLYVNFLLKTCYSSSCSCLLSLFIVLSRRYKLFVLFSLYVCPLLL